MYASSTPNRDGSTSKTLGSPAKPCAIAASSRSALAYGGSGISVGNSRSCFGHFGFRELIDCNLMLECLQDGVLLRGAVELLLGMLEDGLGGGHQVPGFRHSPPPT